MSQSLTIYVVDDDPTVVDSLCIMLHAEGFRTTGYSSVAEFLAAFDPVGAGCVVADVRMPQLGGLELQDELRARGYEIPFVLITASANLSSGIQALKRGALNYLEKPFRARDMIDAISEALQISRARQSENIAHRDFHQRLQQLSSDEYAVLVGIATGQTNAKIADRIDVSLRTLQFRRGEMMRKMGVASKEELMHLIFRVGWNPPA